MFIGYHQDAPRVERRYKGTKKPNSIGSDSWRSMNRAEREGYVEAERQESELQAMGRNDSRDAAPVDIDYDSSYESSTERHDKDYWMHDVKAGTVTRFHFVNRRARFDDPSTLSDARITMAMTDGTEFTVQDSWRAADPRPLPCRWTGKTVFVTGRQPKAMVKVKTVVTGITIEKRTACAASGFLGHALISSAAVQVPARSPTRVQKPVFSSRLHVVLQHECNLSTALLLMCAPLCIDSMRVPPLPMLKCIIRPITTSTSPDVPR